MTSPDSGSAAPQYQKRSRPKRGMLLAGALVAVLVIAAVTFFLTRPQENGASGEGENSRGGTLTVGLVLEPTNLNVLTTPGVALDQVLIDNVYQGLVGLRSGSLEVVPVLAKEFTVSADGLEYVFPLREGVTFHSGNALTVEDVVDSLTASLSAVLPESALEVSGDADANSVTITLPQPDSGFLALLAGRAGLILEQAATNDLNNSANGTGPYALESWKQGDSITLTAVPNYWGTAPTLDTVVFRYIPDGKAAVNAALSGDIDVQTAVLPELLSEYEGNADFELVNAESTDVFTLAYNAQKPALQNPEVRAALSQAIDQDAILAALNDAGKPLGSPITELEQGYRDLTSVNAYDPEQARATLTQAGLTGSSLTLTIPNFYGATATDLLVTQFADVGITLDVREVEFATWLEDVYTNKNFDLSFVDHAEAGDFGNYANPDYYFGYDSAEVQELFAQALASTDPERVDQLLGEAASIVATDAPAKWLYNSTPTTAIGSHVQNFPTANTNSRINLEGVSVQG